MRSVSSRLWVDHRRCGVPDRFMLVAADLSVVAYDEQPAIVSAIDIADNASIALRLVVRDARPNDMHGFLSPRTAG